MSAYMSATGNWNSFNRALMLRASGSTMRKDMMFGGIVIYALTLLVALTGKWTRTTIGVCPESLVLLLLKEI